MVANDFLSMSASIEHGFVRQHTMREFFEPRDMMRRYKNVLEKLATSNVSSEAASAMSSVQVHVSSDAASSCTGHDNFTEALNYLRYTTGDNVWKSIDVEKTMRCVPDCLGNSFTIDFMSNFASLVNVCNSTDTKLTDVVSHLDAALTSLNAIFHDKAYHFRNISSWKAAYASYRTSVETLTANASLADDYLQTAAVRDIIRRSCAYPNKKDQMELTCAGFKDAQELTDEIKQLDHELKDEDLAYTAMGGEVNWNRGTFDNVFCSDTNNYHRPGSIDEQFF